MNLLWLDGIIGRAQENQLKFRSAGNLFDLYGYEISKMRYRKKIATSKSSNNENSIGSNKKL